MTNLQLVLSAILQGITELLPISSSAHTLLLSNIMRWDQFPKLFSVITHLGSALGIFIYYRHTFIKIIKDFISLKTNNKLFWKIVVATIPVSVLGFTAKDLIKIYFYNETSIIISSIIFSIILYFAVIRYSPSLNQKKIGFRVAFLIGCAQMFALFPGASRLGVTLTVALLLGVELKSAAKFSFMLAVPVIIGASSLEIISCYEISNLEYIKLTLSFLVTLITSYLGLYFALRYIFTPTILRILAAYRFILATTLLTIKII